MKFFNKIIPTCFLLIKYKNCYSVLLIQKHNQILLDKQHFSSKTVKEEDIMI